MGTIKHWSIFLAWTRNLSVVSDAELTLFSSGESNFIKILTKLLSRGRAISVRKSPIDSHKKKRSFRVYQGVSQKYLTPGHCFCVFLPEFQSN